MHEACESFCNFLSLDYGFHHHTTTNGQCLSKDSVCTFPNTFSLISFANPDIVDGSFKVSVYGCSRTFLLSKNILFT
ncbi:hypothetical protein BHM03_00000237 [Ensete ventricosum]|nr:hypothetical protein BHM03_00000237 [Ensete ventricosum]